MDPTKAKLVIRNAEPADAGKIVRLTSKVYGRGEGYTAAQIRGQINNFPDGQFVAEYEGKIVGYCATLILQQQQHAGSGGTVVWLFHLGAVGGLYVCTLARKLRWEGREAVNPWWV